MNDMENVPLTAEELALARRWATSQIGRPSTRTDTQPLSRRKATVLIYRLLATLDERDRRSSIDAGRLADALYLEGFGVGGQTVMREDIDRLVAAYNALAGPPVR